MKDERIIGAVQFEIKLFDFFYQSKQLTDYIYTDIHCNLSKCIGYTPCSYEHYLVGIFFFSVLKIGQYFMNFRETISNNDLDASHY